MELSADFLSLGRGSVSFNVILMAFGLFKNLLMRSIKI